MTLAKTSQKIFEVYFKCGFDSLDGLEGHLRLLFCLDGPGNFPGVVLQARNINFEIYAHSSGPSHYLEELLWEMSEKVSGARQREVLHMQEAW